MNILILGKPFYNYHELIKQEFENNNDRTTFVSDSPKNHLLVRRIFGEKIEKKLIKFFQEIKLKKDIKNDYDIILVLVGRYVTKTFLKKIKNKNPKAKYILYLWDDIKRIENFEDTKMFYDVIYSFDYNDCINNNFCFLPLFYSRDYKLNVNLDKKIDIYGSFSEHSERVNIAQKILEQCYNKKMNCKFLFYPGRFKYIKNFFKNREIEKKSNKEIKYIYNPINGVINLKNINECKALLDVQYASQNGLTMRTIEAIGCGVKLITTNSNIKKYDFYNENNCLVIDRNNPIIDEEFLKKAYVPLSQKIYEKYSIKSWVEIIRNNKKENYLK